MTIRKRAKIHPLIALILLIEIFVDKSLLRFQTVLYSNLINEFNYSLRQHNTA
jgi:hypothetical protein